MQLRADYFDNPDDKAPSHSEYLEANDIDEAATKAVAKAGNWMRVDLAITFAKKRFQNER